MFQVDAGRSVGVDPHESRTRFGAQTSGVVADHLDNLLGEHLLPLRPRQGDEDAPHLLAVDAAGQPVVVEVVPLLDQAALLGAMRHAGRAARLSTQDLAQAYRGGADCFAADLAAFRETVPATSLLSTTVNGGSRLLLVCSEVAEGMEDAIEFLLQPGWQVEVLQVGVVQGPDGRRIVEVSPVTRTTPSRRAMEPAVRSAPRGLRPVSSVRSDTTPHVPAAHAQQWAPAPPQASTAVPGAPAAAGRPPRRPPTIVAPPFAVRLVGTVPDAPDDEDDDTSEHPTVERVNAERLNAERVDAERLNAERLTSERPSAEALPYAFTGVAPPVGARPDARLVRLAADLGEPVALVWSRRRRGECFEAALHPDGFIELPDGSRHTDPDTAAVAASCSSGPVDGWNVWRIDSPWGRTLEEACGP